MLDRRWVAGPLVLSACLLPACAAKPFAEPASIQTSASPDQSFQCVTLQLDSLGYKRSSYDKDDRRITGTQIDTEARRPDTQFRRLLNRIEVEVAAGTNGQTSIEAVGHTFGEYTTQRGPTEVEEKASDDVKSATQKLLAKCRS
jgi:hypothetical protein